MRLISCLLALCTLLAAPLPARAQSGGLFSPYVFVNDRAVTVFEFEQRVLMLQLFRAPGDIEAEARQALIDDRLRKDAGALLGLELSPEAIQAGMEEFAARANLSAEEFIAALAQAGVAEESFRDFVEAGLLWREVVRARFGPRAQVTDVEIDRAIAATTERVGVRVLVSEIRLAAEPGQESSARSLAARLRREIASEAEFADAARNYSSGPTAGAGGRLDWMALSNLPAEVATQVLGLRPGQISNPVSVEGAVVLYLVRDLQQTGPQAATATSVEYARLALPAGRDPAEEAARIRARLDTCDDLYGVAPGAPESQLLRETRSLGELPADLALALAPLDDNETTLYVAAGQPSLVMLCGRVPVFEDAPNRELVRRDLLNRRLAAYADGYLEELRADAIIREP